MRKYYFFFGEGSKINQFICALLINLPILAYGTGIGWMSPMTLLLQSNQSPTKIPLSDTVVSWMASCAYVTCIPSTIIFAILEEKCGRKIALLCMSSMMVICWIIKLASMEVWAFILARSAFGVSMGAAFVVCPVYTKEISEDSIRGLLGSFVVLSQTIGNLITYIIGDYMSYRAILWFCLSLPTFHIILFLMMPESPSFLVKNGNLKEAARVLAWLRCRNEDSSLVKTEVEIIKKEQENDSESSKFAMKAIFKDKILRRAFGIAMAVTLAREVCGANPVLNFAGYIFELSDSGLVLSPNQQAMMLGAVQVAGSALASSVVEKSGRKPLLFVSSLVSGIGMCGLASWFLARSLGATGAGWLPITSLCLCIFCDAAGLQPISVVVMNEIFSFKYRSTVSAVTMGTASTSDVFQLLLFKPLANTIGIHYCFYFFGAVCLVNAVYVVVYLPETKMRGLDEIYEDLKTKKEKEEERRCMKT